MLLRLNREYIKRDEIVFGTDNAIDWSRNGVADFKGLTLKQLEELLDGDFLDTHESQDPKAPTIKQFMEFMETHPGFTAHGYVVSPNRKDYGIVLAGLELKGEYTDRTEADFLILCRSANRLEIEEKSLYSWWD